MKAPTIGNGKYKLRFRCIDGEFCYVLLKKFNNEWCHIITVREKFYSVIEAMTYFIFTKEQRMFFEFLTKSYKNQTINNKGN